jgi:hypothetical protein
MQQLRPIKGQLATRWDGRRTSAGYLARPATAGQCNHVDGGLFDEAASHFGWSSMDS